MADEDGLASPQERQTLLMLLRLTRRMLELLIELEGRGVQLDRPYCQEVVARIGDTERWLERRPQMSVASLLEVGQWVRPVTDELLAKVAALQGQAASA